MFGQIFASLGGFIGNSLGGGILSTIGRFAGKAFGNHLDRGNYKHTPQEYYHIRNVRDNFNLTTASYGQPIPIIFGSCRVDGKIIWSTQVKESKINTTEQKYFADSSKVKAIHYNTECEYFLSFAIAICEGEIAEIGRVWANSDLINLGNYKFTLYLGSEEQLANHLIEDDCRDFKAPAFRGLSYIVFEALPLSDFNNSIPNFSFEVIRKANVTADSSVEDIVKSMIMIPGSGEFVYDTIVQYKLTKRPNGSILSKKPINSHNYSNLPNSLYSLKQLKITCANVEWIAPVVCWFGDSLDTSLCKILAAVEFNDPNIGYSEEWRVGQYERSTAKLISRDLAENPRYGGSVNDASVIRYLKELKLQGLKIMFYPMFFLDIELKPWRGHLTGAPETIAEFFNKPDGYNSFILHYANLVKDHIDAFVIGSELIGLTSITDGIYFPAVRELIKLAELVKKIVGQGVAVTYAADWSEYHHTAGGWYNLDPLWASPSIDFIGIDSYFPVTRTTSSNILPEDIVKGWKTGEGFDYYVDKNGLKQSVEPAYAWKNLRYWWENYHHNPDGIKTEWQPRMKKIWFTEFGFPSIDKATNQPNVFFDPLCFDGGVPKHSSGEIDFSIQRKAIRAFIEYWEQEEYIGQMFLWTWDARPYPAWPHMNVWRDGYLWEKGHWVNNKFGAVSVAAIILELSVRCGIDSNKIDVSDLDESVEGMTLNKSLSVIDAINLLRINHFFDIVATQKNKIRFVKRGCKNPYSVSSKMLMKLGDNTYFQQSDIARESILHKIEIHFIDQSDEYNSGYCQINNENLGTKATAQITLPISLSKGQAEAIGRLILKNALIEDKIVKFMIPANSLDYEPSDVVTLNYLNYQYHIRIIQIKLQGLTLEITGILDDFESYRLDFVERKQELEYNPQIESKFIIMELPSIFNNRPLSKLIYNNSKL